MKVKSCLELECPIIFTLGSYNLYPLAPLQMIHEDQPQGFPCWQTQLAGPRNKGVKKPLLAPLPPIQDLPPHSQMTKPSLCLGKVQHYISDLSVPNQNSRNGEKKKKSPFSHYSLHIQVNICLKYPDTILVQFSPSQVSTLVLNLLSPLLSAAHSTFLPLYLLLSFFL